MNFEFGKVFDWVSNQAKQVGDQVSQAGSAIRGIQDEITSRVQKSSTEPANLVGVAAGADASAPAPEAKPAVESANSTSRTPAAAAAVAVAESCQVCKRQLANPRRCHRCRQTVCADCSSGRVSSNAAGQTGWLCLKCQRASTEKPPASQVAEQRLSSQRQSQQQQQQKQQQQQSQQPASNARARRSMDAISNVTPQQSAVLPSASMTTTNKTDKTRQQPTPQQQQQKHQQHQQQQQQKASGKTLSVVTASGGGAGGRRSTSSLSERSGGSRAEQRRRISQPPPQLQDSQHSLNEPDPVPGSIPTNDDEAETPTGAPPQLVQQPSLSSMSTTMQSRGRSHRQQYQLDQRQQQQDYRRHSSSSRGQRDPYREVSRRASSYHQHQQQLQRLSADPDRRGGRYYSAGVVGSRELQGGGRYSGDLGGSSSRRHSSLSSEPGGRYRSYQQQHQHQRQHRSSLSSSEEDEQQQQQLMNSYGWDDSGFDTFSEIGQDRRHPAAIDAKVKSFLSHPVAWQLSNDRKRLIGHMLLKKETDQHGNTVDLGLKVIGGKRTHSGRLGAFITNVKPDSVADQVGDLRPGDEVLEWNGCSLKSLDFQEVYDILVDSKLDKQVELIVQRFIDNSAYRDRPLSRASQVAGRVTTRAASQESKRSAAAANAGRIQLKFWYDFDSASLSVGLLSAFNLVPPARNQLSNAFVVLNLLPYLNERRQSKIVSYNNDPMWNQNFVFAPVTEDDIRDGSLRVEVLDYDDFNGSESIGEVEIVLSDCKFNDQPNWFRLASRWESNATPTPMYPDRLSENHRSAAQRADRGRALPATDFSAAVGRAASSGLTAGALRPTSPTAASDVGFSFGAGSSGGGGGGVVGAPGKKRQLPQVPGGGGGASPFVRIDSPATAAAAAASEQLAYQQLHRQQPPHLQHHRSSLGSRHPAPRLMQEDEAGAISDVSENSDISELSKRSGVSGYSDRHARRSLAGLPATGAAAAAAGHAGGSGSGRSRKASTSALVGADGSSGSGGGNGSGGAGGSRTEKNRRASMGQKFSSFIPGLNRKSSSATNLEKKNKGTFQRSEEVLPPSMTAAAYSRDPMSSNRPGGGHRTQPQQQQQQPQQQQQLLQQQQMMLQQQQMMLQQQQLQFQQQPQQFSTQESSDGSLPSFDPTVLSAAPEGQLTEFVEGLGPGQLVGRQVLGTPCLGEIQLGLFNRKGRLEVEVIRARGLYAKKGAKMLPAPYVKVYLLEAKNCVEKQKTSVTRRTLDPLYQQQLIFMEDFRGKILQVTVWGDYGRMDRKAFMGVCQVMLDDLDLVNIVIGWYKLYPTSSLVHHHHRRSSSSSIDAASTAAAAAASGSAAGGGLR
ncbi:hypothetical protein BOX15_Mlig011495g1 [Macrostomum lignano]|uniref:Regulating synaptic membrane exocytosis protein 2 n=1 Tax=Macrostomum lignano TaxID=282301 RepID=A0A267FD53_9PLAT|nr:hypothetical protein BOX15_Mlig011495g1 [Macrostomum lignano]